MSFTLPGAVWIFCAVWSFLLAWLLFCWSGLLHLKNVSVLWLRANWLHFRSRAASWQAQIGPGQQWQFVMWWMMFTCQEIWKVYYKLYCIICHLIIIEFYFLKFYFWAFYWGPPGAPLRPIFWQQISINSTSPLIDMVTLKDNTHLASSHLASDKEVSTAIPPDHRAASVFFLRL